tara:strand:- start:33442 stop:34380 length:939 start_codon:yes stop_codon:yes gene_type:complete
MTGWLINDCLSTIPGVKGFWHDLLDWMPSLEDRTGGYTAFNVLPDKIDQEASTIAPDYIIRNASYFRALNIDAFTISLMQDPKIKKAWMRANQIGVCNKSDVVVFNSQLMWEHFEHHTDVKHKEIIPLGTDFDLFHPYADDYCEEQRQRLGILENSIVWVGADNRYKGMKTLRWLIDNTGYNFCLVMKDGTVIENDRCRTFTKVPHSELVHIYNACSLCLCTSVFETLHLSSIEAGACGLPVVTTDVGIHRDQPSGEWGERIPDGTSLGMTKSILDKAMAQIEIYRAREHFLVRGLDVPTCRSKWTALVESI